MVHRLAVPMLDAERCLVAVPFDEVGAPVHAP
jgi:hypothetical protein